MEEGELCEVCEGFTPKYTCPACSTRTCSLSCVHKHKQEQSCSGQKRADFLPLRQMTDETITDDSLFLQDTALFKDRIKNRTPSTNDTCFKWMLKERRLLVKTLPSNFTRHKLNQSRAIFGGEKEKKVRWTVEIRNGDKSDHVHDVDEDTPIESFVKGGHSYSLINEGNPRRSVHLDVTRTLREVLTDLTIIEFPILVANKDHASKAKSEDDSTTKNADTCKSFDK